MGKEVILHGIKILAHVGPDKDSDKHRVQKILKELKPGVFKIRNGDIAGTKRQIRNRNTTHQPITI